MTTIKITQWLTRLSPFAFCPPSKFKKGDIVRTEDSGHIMKVVSVIKERGMKRPIILCEWVEIQPKQRRKNLFLEERLQFIY